MVVNNTMVYGVLTKELLHTGTLQLIPANLIDIVTEEGISPEDVEFLRLDYKSK